MNPPATTLATSLLAGILPAGVRSSEAFDDLVPAPLFAAEEEMLAGAGPKRRGEFATVRRCARDALGELGIPPSPLLRGERGAPVWPDGVVGSMTHCTGYRGAAVAAAGEWATVGIDAEPAEPLPYGVLPLVTGSDERDHLAELALAEPSVCWDRLLFCAKEAVYKAWFPLTRRWLGFHDAVVELSTDRTFTAKLLVGGGFSGRWTMRRGLLVATIVA